MSYASQLLGFETLTPQKQYVACSWGAAFAGAAPCQPAASFSCSECAQLYNAAYPPSQESGFLWIDQDLAWCGNIDSPLPFPCTTTMVQFCSAQYPQWGNPPYKASCP